MWRIFPRIFLSLLLGNKLDKKFFIDKENQYLIDVFLGKIIRRLKSSKSSKDFILSPSKQKENLEAEDKND